MARIQSKRLNGSLMVVNMTMTDYKTLQLMYGITKMLWLWRGTWFVINAL